MSCVDVRKLYKKNFLAKVRKNYVFYLILALFFFCDLKLFLCFIRSLALSLHTDYEKVSSICILFVIACVVHKQQENVNRTL